MRRLFQSDAALLVCHTHTYTHVLDPSQAACLCLSEGPSGYFVQNNKFELLLEALTASKAPTGTCPGSWILDLPGTRISACMCVFSLLLKLLPLLVSSSQRQKATKRSCSGLQITRIPGIPPRVDLSPLGTAPVSIQYQVSKLEAGYKRVSDTQITEAFGAFGTGSRWREDGS